MQGKIARISYIFFLLLFLISANHTIPVFAVNNNHYIYSQFNESLQIFACFDSLFDFDVPSSTLLTTCSPQTILESFFFIIKLSNFISLLWIHKYEWFYNSKVLVLVTSHSGIFLSGLNSRACSRFKMAHS